MTAIVRNNNGMDTRRLLTRFEFPSTLYSRVAALERPSSYPTGGIRGGGDPNFGFEAEIPIINSITPVADWNGLRWILGMTIVTAYEPPPTFVALNYIIDDGEGFNVPCTQFAPYTSAFDVGDLGFQYGHTYSIKVRAVLSTGPTNWSDWYTGVFFNPTPNIPIPPEDLSRDLTFNGGEGWAYLPGGVSWGLLWDYFGPLPVDEWQVTWEVAANPELNGSMGLPGDWPGPPYGVVVNNFQLDNTYDVTIRVRRGTFWSDPSAPLIVTPTTPDPEPASHLGITSYTYNELGAEITLEWDAPSVLPDTYHLIITDENGSIIYIIRDIHNIRGNYTSTVVKGIPRDVALTYTLYSVKYGFESQSPATEVATVPHETPSPPTSLTKTGMGTSIDRSGTTVGWATFTYLPTSYTGAQYWASTELDAGTWKEVRLIGNPLVAEVLVTGIPVNKAFKFRMRTGSKWGPFDGAWSGYIGPYTISTVSDRDPPNFSDTIDGDDLPKWSTYASTGSPTAATRLSGDGYKGLDAMRLTFTGTQSLSKVGTGWAVVPGIGVITLGIRASHLTNTTGTAFIDYYTSVGVLVAGSSSTITVPAISVANVWQDFDSKVTIPTTAAYAMIRLGGSHTGGATNTYDWSVVGWLQREINTVALAPGAVTTPIIGSLAVDSSKIAALAVIAGKIASGAVGTTEIASAAITSGLIANGAVIAGKIGVGGVSASNQLASGVVDSTAIGLGAVGAANLAVGTLSGNLIANASLEQGTSGWSSTGGTGTFSTVIAVDAPSGDYVGVMPGGGALGVGALAVPVAPGQVLQMRITVKASAGGGAWYFRMFEKANAPSGGYITVGNHDSFTDKVSGAVAPTSWTKYDYEYTVPAGVYWIGFTLYNTSASGTTLWFDDAVLLPQVSANAIGSGAIISGKIGALAVGTSEIANLAIDSSKLGALAVIAGKIASGAINASALFAASVVDSAAIGAGAVIAGKIGANAVGSSEIASGAVISGKLGVGAISAANLFTAGVIDSAAIANLAISTSKLALLAVDSTILAANAVTAGKIASAAINGAGLFAAGVVDSAALGAGSVTAGKIGVGGISAANQFSVGVIDSAAIAALAVTNAKLALLSVNTGNIIANAVTTAKIALLAIDSTLLASAAVTAGKIAAGAINASNLFAASVVDNAAIGPLAVDGPKLAAGAVTAGKIGVGGVSASNQLAANVVDSAAIGPLAVGTLNIAGGAITFAKMASNSVTAAQIVTGSVTRIKVADSAIGAAQLAPGISQSPPNGSMEQPDTAGTFAAGWTKTGTVAYSNALAIGAGDGQYAMQMGLATGLHSVTSPLELWTKGKSYSGRLRWREYLSVVGAALAIVHTIRCYDASLAYISSLPVTPETTNIAGGWMDNSGSWDGNTIPANTAYVAYSCAITTSTAVPYYGIDGVEFMPISRPIAASQVEWRAGSGAVVGTTSTNTPDLNTALGPTGWWRLIAGMGVAITGALQSTTAAITGAITAASIAVTGVCSAASLLINSITITIGSSFPGSPSTGNIHYRSDLNVWCRYTAGIGWLGHETVVAQHNYLSAPAYSSTTEALACSLTNQNALYLTRFIASYYCGGGVDSLNHWRIHLRTLTAAIGFNYQVYIQTTSNSWHKPSTDKVPADMSNNPLNASDIWLQLYLEKTGNPNPIYVQAQIWGRLIYT